jgi:hypothetical protein
MFQIPKKECASFIALMAAVSWSGSAVSQDAASKKDFGPGKLTGYYSIYSGALGDEVLRPNKKDAKVRFTVTGRTAARMFDYMGSGATQNSCVDSEVARIRDELVCTQNKGTHETECYFGFDLHSGKSIGGVTC